MPNIKSAKKRVKVNAVKAFRNKRIKSNLKTILKKADAAITGSGEDKKDAVILAIKTVDKACAKGVMHKNKAARQKSQLARKLASV
ncbi:MAG: 30S ribosomal protein S20 [Oscillospiraceae bacterium]|nr:30S ribosomal protein S20 [Oscillospiraceae bacterium]